MVYRTEYMVYGMWLGLKVVPMSLLWGLCMYYRGTWTRLWGLFVYLSQWLTGELQISFTSVVGPYEEVRTSFPLWLENRVAIGGT